MEITSLALLRPLRSVFVFIFGVLALSTSAFAPALAEETPAPALKRIGVISMVGDRLFQRQLGVLAFGNKFEDYDAGDLNLDAIWETKIREAAAPFGSFEFVDLALDKSALIATYPKKSNWINTWRHLRFKKTAPIFAQIAADNRLDNIIVLGADAYDVVEGVMQVEGAGIYTTKRLGGSGTMYHLISQLALIDGATGAPIETQYLTVGSKWTKAFSGFPVVDAPAAVTAKLYTEYTPEEKAMLRDLLSSIADRAWTRSLAKLFGVEPPADSAEADALISAEQPAGETAPDDPPASHETGDEPASPDEQN